MYGYDLQRALGSLSGPIAEAKRAIALQCPQSSQRMRADAQGLSGYPTLSRALTACADGTDQVVDELAKRVSNSWKSYSGPALQCWGQISEGAKADGISSTPLMPSAGPAPTPEASPSPSPTSASPPQVSWAWNESAEEPDPAPADLAAADAKLNATWSRIRPRFSDDEWAKLRDLQRRWIRDRDKQCGTSQTCLLDWTNARVDWLDQYKPDQ
jgi:uncharacterized protein YecT (DUF1311 family)